MFNKIMAAVIAATIATTTIAVIPDTTISVSAASSSYSTGSYSVASSKGSNIRNGPGTSYSRVGAASQGVQFYVERISGDWGYTSAIRTTTGTKNGWINLGYCNLIKADFSFSGTSSSVSVSTESLDFDAMYDYAKKYWNEYNTVEYRSYKDKLKDCVNFVCQILEEGGVPETNKWHGSYSYSSSSITSSFTYSPDMISYFRTEYGIPYYNKTKLSSKYKDGSSFSINDIQQGDVISINGTYGRDHVMYVLGKSGNYVHFAAHTNDRFYGKNGGSIHISNIKGLLKTSQIKLNSTSNMLYGDVNGNSSVTTTDMVQLQRYLDNPSANPLNNPKAADVNGDGRISNEDLDVLRRYLAGLISTLPCKK